MRTTEQRLLLSTVNIVENNIGHRVCVRVETVIGVSVSGKYSIYMRYQARRQLYNWKKYNVSAWSMAQNGLINRRFHNMKLMLTLVVYCDLPIFVSTVSDWTSVSTGNVTCLPGLPHPPCWTENGVDPNTGSLPVIKMSSVSLVTDDIGDNVMFVMQGLVTMVRGRWTVTTDSGDDVSCSNTSEVEFSNDCNGKMCDAKFCN